MAMDAIGVHSFWGFSPALDLQQVHRTVFGAPLPPGMAGGGDVPGAPLAPLRVLCVSPGDIRHVLKTVAQRRRHSDRPVHVYLYERTPEVLARHLILLAAATDWAVPLRQRAATWLELFGNALVQARTSRYLTDTLLPAVEKLLVGEEDKAPEPLRSAVDVMQLKSKQRDELDAFLRTCRDGAPCDMAAWRDQRCRNHYGTRFDFRNNLIDWDYQAVIRPSAGCIHFSQYRDWRNTGVGFEYGDQTYDVPNRTMASYAEGRERGSSVMRRGFWGDVVVGPYHAVGTVAYVPTDAEVAMSTRCAEAAHATAITPAASSDLTAADTATPALGSPVAGEGEGEGEADAADAGAGGGDDAPGSHGNHAHQLYDITSRRLGSEQWRHHAVEIATYNVCAWLFEMETGRQYAMRVPHDVYSGLSAVGVTATAATAAPTATAARSTPAVATTDADARARAIARNWGGVTVTLLGGEFEDVLERGRLRGLVDVVTLSGKAVHFMAKPGFADLAAAGGCVIVAETARNVVTLRPDQRTDFARRVLGMGAALGACLVGSDRQLSADTFPVGTVLDGKGSKSTTCVDAAGGAAKPLACVFGPEPELVGLASLRSTTGGLQGGCARAPVPGVPAPKAGVVLRCRNVPMALWSHSPLPHQRLTRTSAGAPAATARWRAAVAGCGEGDAHDVCGGDNPPPEAFVFALLPGPTAEAVAAAWKASVATAGAGAAATSGAAGVAESKD